LPPAIYFQLTFINCKDEAVFLYQIMHFSTGVEKPLSHMKSDEVFV